MNARPLAFVFAVAATLLGATVAPTPAAACGQPSAEDAADMLVREHFASLNLHDREGLLALWNESATVVETEPAMHVEPVASAATRWLATKRPVTFEIAQVATGERAAVVRVNVVRDGKRVEETLFLATADGWRWKIAGETSRPLPAVKPAKKAIASR